MCFWSSLSTFPVVCSVSWPNCFCLVLFYLLIGSTLKRLCLGKERSSSNYLIYFLTLCLSQLCPHSQSVLCLCVCVLLSLCFCSVLSPERCVRCCRTCGLTWDCRINFFFFTFAVVLHGSVDVWIAGLHHCLRIDRLICLWLLMDVGVVILWLLCWQNMSQFISREHDRY